MKDKLREAIIKAVPSLVVEMICPDCGEELGKDEDGTIFCPRCPLLESEKVPTCRPIQLADVLIALGKKFYKDSYKIDLVGNITREGVNWILAVWDLTKTYDEQSKPTKDFLKDLLT